MKSSIRVMWYRVHPPMIKICIRAMQKHTKCYGGFLAKDIIPYVKPLIIGETRHTKSEIAQKLITRLITREKVKGNLIPKILQSVCSRRRAEGKGNTRGWKWVWGK